MANINPGPAVTSTASTLATMGAVNILSQVTPGQATNAYRLLAVGRGISLSGTGDTAALGLINASSWAPALIVTSNGQVNGVPGSIATAAIAVNTGAAGTGSAIKANATLANNNAAGSAIALATTIANLAFTGQVVYVNVGTALAGATVDIFLYGYDVS